MARVKLGFDGSDVCREYIEPDLAMRKNIDFGVNTDGHVAPLSNGGVRGIGSDYFVVRRERSSSKDEILVRTAKPPRTERTQRKRRSDTELVDVDDAFVL